MANPVAVATPAVNGQTPVQPTYAELLAKIKALEAQAGQPKRLSFGIAEKGGVSVYGLGRFPTTLYYEQWLRLLGEKDALLAFLEQSKAAGKLSEKPNKPASVTA